VTRRHPTTRDSIRVEELKEYGTPLLHVFAPANEGDLHTIVELTAVLIRVDPAAGSQRGRTSSRHLRS
jgi:hypothetical protein